MRIVFVAERQEGCRSIFPAEPNHHTCVLAGGYRIPKSLSVGLSLIYVIRETYHGDFFSIRQAFVLLDDLIEAFSVSRLICLPRSVSVIVHLRIWGGTDVLPRQQRQDRRAMHLSVNAAVVDVVQIDSAGLLIVADGLIYISDHRSIPSKSVLMQDVYIEQRSRIITRGELIFRGELGAIRKGKGIGQRRSVR